MESTVQEDNDDGETKMTASTSRSVFIGTLVAVAILAVACGKKDEPVAGETIPTAQETSAPSLMTASAVLEAREDLEVTARVTFTQSGPGEPVTVQATVEGAGEGPHGFHVHEIGDCSAPDFTSAGGHFNPTDVPHGGPDDSERHAGDLGNIEIGPDGTGELQITSEMLSVEDGPGSVVGRAVILHEKADDLVSQPTGAAGPRLACGLIGRDS